ncbi:MAG: nucleotidyltransferase domain-containing protein [Planctomycetota bacterium]|nr:nucleotidyltransferase domain-containing protein [Planctomycetota bacterium]
MDAPTPPLETPAAVQPLLAWWLPRVRDVLGDTYRSALLFGSVAVGDFAPGWSDVDVCVVTTAPLTVEQERRVGELRRDLDAHFLAPDAYGWSSGQTIDALYVTVDELVGRAPSALDPFNRLSLVTCTRLLDGEPARIEPPTEDALRNRTAAFVEEAARPPSEATPIWFASMIQLLARALVYWREGTLVSKSAALERLIQNGDAQADDFALALRVRLEGSAAAAGRESALRDAYGRVAPPTLAELRRLL